MTSAALGSMPSAARLTLMSDAIMPEKTAAEADVPVNV